MTVIAAPRRRGLEGLLRALGYRPGARGIAHYIAVLAALAALAGAVVGERGGSGTTARHRPRVEEGMLGEAAAYRFPLGCLGATLSGQSSLRADDATSRTGPCWHYSVFVTAVLRRVAGVWRLTLDARSDSYPRVPLPAAIRALLTACREDRGPNGARLAAFPRTAAR